MSNTKVVSRDIPIPLYFQVSQIIENEIKAGTYKPGDLFSTEEELQQRLNVSRSTIRKAIDDLKKRGWLIQQVGKGTFVGSFHLSKTKSHLLSLTEELRAKGIQPGTKYISVTSENPSNEVAEKLNYEKEVHVIKRVRTADGVPFVFITQYLPGFFQIIGEEVGESVYEFLERTNGLHLVESIHVVGAAAADKEVAEALQVKEGDPVVIFTRTSSDQIGRTVIYERGYGKAGLYEYRLKVTR
jgi:GntR family transcriptional regulator